jgi:hypothetical protein
MTGPDDFVKYIFAMQLALTQIPLKMPAGALDAGFNTCSNKSAKVCNKRGVNEATGLHDMRSLPHEQAYAATGDVTRNKAGVVTTRSMAAASRMLGL